MIWRIPAKSECCRDGLLKERRELIARSKDIAVTSIKTFLIFAIIELIVTFTEVWKLPSEQFFKDIYDVNLQMIPNAMVPWSNVEEFLNESGFRGKEMSVEKHPDIIRIISIGASNTFGYKVENEKTYTEQIHVRLLKRGIGNEVLNAGVPGTSLWQHRMFFQQHLAKYRPNLVLLYTAPTLDKEIFLMRRKLEHRSLVGNIESFLLQSKTYRFMRKLVNPPENLLNLKNDIDLWKGDLVPLEANYIQAIMKDIQEDLELFKQLCAEIGSDLFLIPEIQRMAFELMIKEGINADDPDWRVKFSKKNGLGELLLQPASNIKIRTYHPEDLFIEAMYKKELFADNDHFNETGHSLFAEFLEKSLLENGIIKPPSAN